jgi:hypothetical protein
MDGQIRAREEHHEEFIFPFAKKGDFYGYE